MKKNEAKSSSEMLRCDRRQLLKGLGAMSAAWGASAWTARADPDEQYRKATRGLAPLKITKVRSILTAPQRARLVVMLMLLFVIIEFRELLISMLQKPTSRCGRIVINIA